jgi:hypothetical protein
MRCCCTAPVLLSSLQELTKQNGEGIARSILAMSEMHTCPDPDQFVSSLRDMFNGLDPEVIRTRTSEVLQDMIEELRQHQVGGEMWQLKQWVGCSGCCECGRVALLVGGRVCKHQVMAIPCMLQLAIDGICFVGGLAAVFAASLVLPSHACPVLPFLAFR